MSNHFFLARLFGNQTKCTRSLICGSFYAEYLPEVHHLWAANLNIKLSHIYES
jgi:hypothetical protein